MARRADQRGAETLGTLEAFAIQHIDKITHIKLLNYYFLYIKSII